MKYLTCADGARLPVVGLGTWKSAPGEVYQAIRQAIELGYRHFDCAAIYGNEAEIGSALADAIHVGELTRDELWVTSKLWNDSHQKDCVLPALRKTLDALQLQYLDLYLIHWPVVFRPGVSFPRAREDYFTLEQAPLKQTWQALEMCVEQGLSRHIGISNFSVRKLQDILSTCGIPPAVNQVEMHPLLGQQKLKKFCDDKQIVLTAFSPLGSSDRPQVYKAGDEPNLFELEVIRDIASARSLSPAQILLAWAVNRGTAVIPKSVNPIHMKANLAAAEIILSDDEMSRISALDRHYRFINGGAFAGKNSPYTKGGIWDEG